MFELIKSLGFALLMVPVVMAGLAALIWGLGEIFNLISKGERHEKQH
ncbi:AcrZ family multidrug efflux pump-associated protein [Morganella morganii]|uniref:Multidrug efflux pump accessory protein AcrZ n=1 Tax=Morganella morganii TaxID=582 RepID=A0A9Q4GPU2_MORMO|nr:AcrZ family multidrug efflux pump-associated protein [Morganella morganii]BEP22194.1 AcrZ family multidrug efflux pump-associated protein [Morganella morganii subsp. sibonii]EGT3622092.1 multidrug efflux pump-associated protein, AcrZ family [Morganella morganii]EGT3630288.1 multidrug efflux pump-associated protein, AcrZ family [Morganella morganii]EGT3632738.1 multidrug efflux pump-associated protein, AcrZ family [Morganella morganii]EJD6038422.1 AcrZ family multidrug efflux pump-associated